MSIVVRCITCLDRFRNLRHKQPTLLKFHLFGGALCTSITRLDGRFDSCFDKPLCRLSQLLLRVTVLSCKCTLYTNHPYHVFSLAAKGSLEFSLFRHFTPLTPWSRHLEIKRSLHVGYEVQNSRLYQPPLQMGTCYREHVTCITEEASSVFLFIT